MKNDNRQLRYIVYTRKSTESEDRQTLSLDDQKRETDALIEKENLQVVESFAGKSKGESQSAHKRGRPIFKHVMEQIENGKANGLVVYHPNRIARNAFDGGYVITLMDEGKLLEIRTPTKTYLNNPDDKFWLALEFNMAKKSSDDNGVAVTRGIKTKLLAGWYPSRAPLGYLNTKNFEEKGKNFILKDPQRFNTVKQMWQMMLTGNYTVPQILKIANDEWKLKTRPTKKYIGLKSLSRTNLYKIFNNPFYYGFFEYGKGEHRQIYKGNHDAMITEEEFDRVQKILGRRGKPRPKQHRFAFTGLMRCSNCGAMVTAEEKIKRQKNGNVHTYIYYHCTKRIDANCPEKMVELAELNQQIDAAIGEFTVSERFKDWAVQSLHELRKDEAQNHQIVFENKQKVLNDVTRRLEALVVRWSSPENADGQFLTDQEYQTLKTSMLKERATVENEVQEQGRTIQDWVELSERTFNFARYAHVWFAKGDRDTKRAIFACLGSHLYLGGQKVAIKRRKVFDMIFEALPNVEQELATVRTSANSHESAINKAQIPTLAPELSSLRRG